MVSLSSKSTAQLGVKPRFIYITGCDGTGKTTQAELILDHLKQAGLDTHHLWLRFAFFLSIPLMAYARWRGHSWFEEKGDVRQGYWDFRGSWLLQHILPWTLLIDAAIAASYKLYWPLLRGKTIVCERFVFDMLVDLALAYQDYQLHQRWPGSLYRHLIPKNALVVILDGEAETLKTRRPDLKVDKRLEDRLKGFRTLVDDIPLISISSALSIDKVRSQILEMIED